MSPTKHCARQTYKIHMYTQEVHLFIFIIALYFEIILAPTCLQKRTSLVFKEGPFVLIKLRNALRLFVKLSIPYVAL